MAVTKTKPKPPTKTKVKTKKGKNRIAESTIPKRRNKISEGKPGICIFVVDMLKGRSSKRPITKQEMIDRVVKRFPTRDPNKMEATIKRFTYWVPKNHGYTVLKSKKGYWIETEE